MLKKISLITLSITLSLFTLLNAKEKEIEPAEIGDTAVQLSSLRIFRGQSIEKLFNPASYNIIVFWEFDPTFAKPSKEKLSKEEKKEKLQASYAVHEELFKIKQTLASQKQGNKVRVIAINSESPEKTSEYLKEMEKYFKERASKKDGKITVPIYDAKTKKIKEEERPWSCNYALGYDAPKKLTKIPKDENPILRGKIWEDYVTRFGQEDAPIAFIIGKPSAEDAKEYAKEQKNKKRSNYPDLVNARVLWMGSPEQIADEIQSLLEEKKNSKKRSR